MTVSHPLTRYFDEHRTAILDELFELLRFPSISAEKARMGDIEACCKWLTARLKRAGATVEVWPSPVSPTIFATWPAKAPGRPTVLLYNHYDVQPVDPIELWQSSPFDPEIRDGEIYARGAQDNKGQLWSVLVAIEALREKHGGDFPVNIKWCIEGDEEIGSQGLASILAQHQDALKADHLLVVDVGVRHLRTPSITLGVRGVVTMTLSVTASNTDLHSGTHGGIVYNPNRATAELLAQLHKPDGTVALPGFYDGIEPLSDEERAQIWFDFDAGQYRAMFGAEATGGEVEYSPLESAWIRPTVEINGIGGGYFGEGFKTVIPAQTISKISVRTVAGQEPRKLAESVRAFLLERSPKGVHTTVTIHEGMGEAVRTTPRYRVVQCAAKAVAEVFGTECRYIYEGGSMPIAGGLGRAAGADVVFLGLGLPDDNIHAPNEHFGVERIRLSSAVYARTLEIIGGYEG